MKQFLCLVGLVLLAGMLPAITADEVAGKTGIAGGFCAFPMADRTDAALVVELAKQPSFVVHAQSTDAAVVAGLRAAAETAGLLGRSLYVEQGGPSPLPYADHFVDLLVMDTLRDSDLTPALRAALLRVLSPGRGVALVGRVKSSGHDLTKKALRTWAGALPQATIPLAMLRLRLSGSWIICV